MAQIRGLCHREGMTSFVFGRSLESVTKERKSWSCAPLDGTIVEVPDTPSIRVAFDGLRLTSHPIKNNEVGGTVNAKMAGRAPAASIRSSDLSTFSRLCFSTFKP